MKVFATDYLEPLVSEQLPSTKEWNWQPANPNVKEIYASGSKTATRSSTYSTEKDNESDNDRPNEGR
jgi:hypothetical protein